MQILEIEERLKIAMLQSDVSVLNELLADDLIFTNHLGHLMTKQDDLDAHKSNTLKINEITLTEQQIKIDSGLAIVIVKARIVGSFNGKQSENDFRFTRVWSKSVNKTWQVIVGHSSIVI